MTQIVLEHIDDATFARLSEMATLNRVSVQEQAERLLSEALDMRERRRLRVESAARIAAMTPKDVAQTDSVILLREDRQLLVQFLEGLIVNLIERGVDHEGGRHTNALQSLSRILAIDYWKIRRKCLQRLASLHDIMAGVLNQIPQV